MIKKEIKNKDKPKRAKKEEFTLEFKVNLWMAITNINVIIVNKNEE